MFTHTYIAGVIVLGAAHLAGIGGPVIPSIAWVEMLAGGALGLAGIAFLFSAAFWLMSGRQWWGPPVVSFGIAAASMMIGGYEDHPVRGLTAETISLFSLPAALVLLVVHFAFQFAKGDLSIASKPTAPLLPHRMTLPVVVAVLACTVGVLFLAAPMVGEPHYECRPPAFDVAAARRAGTSEHSIAMTLALKAPDAHGHYFRVNEAIKAGYSDAEIIDYLTCRKADPQK